MASDVPPSTKEVEPESQIKSSNEDEANSVSPQIDDDVVISEEQSDSSDASSDESLDRPFLIPVFLPSQTDNPPRLEDRYAFYVKQIRLDRCPPKHALQKICSYIEQTLHGQHWLAEIKQQIPIVELNLLQEVRYLVEVTSVDSIETNLGQDLRAQCKFIKILDVSINEETPQEYEFSDTEWHLILKKKIRETVQEGVEFTSLRPVDLSDSPLELGSLEYFAELIDHYNFFQVNIHRHYDLSEDEESSFELCLRNRIGIMDLLEKGKIPNSIKRRYDNIRRAYWGWSSEFY
jgi:hypothetical protein